MPETNETTAPAIDAVRMIRQHASATGWTLWELFQKADVAYSNWGRWQAGYSSPSVRTLNTLLAVPKKAAAP